MQNQYPMQQSLDNIYKRRAKIILDYENDRINEYEYKQLMSGNKIFMNNILSKYNSMYPKGAPEQLKHNYVSPSSLIEPSAGSKWVRAGNNQSGYRDVLTGKKSKNSNFVRAGNSQSGYRDVLTGKNQKTQILFGRETIKAGIGTYLVLDGKQINIITEANPVTKSEYLRNIGYLAPRNPFGYEYEGEQF